MEEKGCQIIVVSDLNNQYRTLNGKTLTTPWQLINLM